MKENFIHNYHIIGNIYCDNVWKLVDMNVIYS